LNSHEVSGPIMMCRSSSVVTLLRDDRLQLVVGWCGSGEWMPVASESH